MELNKDLLITRDDLLNWLDKSPSNDDIDLATFISTRLKLFYEFEKRINTAIAYIKGQSKFVEGCDIYKICNKDVLLEILEGKEGTIKR